MLWVLKRPVSMRRAFEHPKHMLKLWVRKYLKFYAENFCLSKPMIFDLDLWFYDHIGILKYVSSFLIICTP